MRTPNSKIHLIRTLYNYRVPNNKHSRKPEYDNNSALPNQGYEQFSGMKPQRRHDIKIRIGMMNAMKSPEEIQSMHRNVLGPDLQVQFRPVRDDMFADYLGAAVQFYGKPFRAWVMLWPDKEGRLPGEPGCRITLQDEAIAISGA